MLKIKKGEELIFTRDEKIICKVVDNRKVEYNNAPYSLTALTREILQLKYNWKSSRMNGFGYWIYDDEILSARRERIEKEMEEDK